MKETQMTDYTFDLSGKVKVKVQGNDSDENYQKAMELAVKLALKEIDEDWI
jgi:hypothetical protein